jgi:hypothetical protein
MELLEMSMRAFSSKSNEYWQRVYKPRLEDKFGVVVDVYA